MQKSDSETSDASQERTSAKDHAAMGIVVQGGTVLRFPLDRRYAKIAAVVRTLDMRKTEEGRARYWSRIVSDLSHELVRHGADSIEVRRQIDAFTTAVGRGLQN